MKHGPRANIRYFVDEVLPSIPPTVHIPLIRCFLVATAVFVSIADGIADLVLARGGGRVAGDRPKNALVYTFIQVFRSVPWGFRWRDSPYLAIKHDDIFANAMFDLNLRFRGQQLHEASDEIALSLPLRPRLQAVVGRIQSSSWLCRRPHRKAPLIWKNLFTSQFEAGWSKILLIGEWNVAIGNICRN